jgi:hypothetical protein
MERKDIVVPETPVSEVPSISAHALDVLAEIYAEKDPTLAKFYLTELADKYDKMRKNYLVFRSNRL